MLELTGVSPADGRPRLTGWGQEWNLIGPKYYAIDLDDNLNKNFRKIASPYILSVTSIMRYLNSYHLADWSKRNPHHTSLTYTRPSP